MSSALCGPSSILACVDVRICMLPYWSAFNSGIAVKVTADLLCRQSGLLHHILKCPQCLNSVCEDQ